MTVTKLNITTFAGVSDASVSFHPTLNILVGPNEAGKSTLFYALYHTLCTPVKLTKSRFQNTLGAYLPLDGGDTIAVSLMFITDDGEHRVDKRWGSGASAQLRLPSGSVLADDDSISSFMENVLSVTPGTLRSILMTSQSQLTNTLADIGSDKTTVFSIQDVLRKAVQETDGISVDRLREIINKQLSSHYGRWDRSIQGPEGNRGIMNPWRQGSGIILESWYAKERLKSQHESIILQEEEIIRISRQMSLQKKRLQETTEFLNDHRQAFDQTGGRESLRSKLRESNIEEENLTKAYDSWPALESSRGKLESQIGEIKTSMIALADELDLARKKEKHEELLRRIDRAKLLKRRLDATSERMAQIAPVENKDIIRLRRLQGESEALRTALTTGSSTVIIDARDAMDLLIRRPVEEPIRLRMKKGDAETLSLKGFVEIEHADWSVHIRPGDEDYKKLDRAYRGIVEDYADSLKSLKATTLDELEERLIRYDRAKVEVAAAKSALEDGLEGEDYAELQGRLEVFGLAADARPIEVLIKESTELEHEGKAASLRLEGIADRLANLNTEYGERSVLLDRLLDVREKRKRVQTELDSFDSLPEGYEGWDEFISAYRQRSKERETLRDDYHLAEKKRIVLEAKLPENSSEEIEVELEEAVRIFANATETGAALERISVATNDLLEGYDTDHSLKLRSAFETNMGKLTEGRYTLGAFDPASAKKPASRKVISTGLPFGVAGRPGVVYPYDLLSTGTKDTFALALRLALTDLFLSEVRGFAVFDDPLVDMDPERRRAAAALLAEYSERTQLMVFTCHPSHARLFPEQSIIEFK